MQVEVKNRNELTKEMLLQNFRTQYMTAGADPAIKRFIEPFLLYDFAFLSEYENVNPFFTFMVREAGVLTIYEEGKISAVNYVIPMNRIALLGDDAKKKAVHDWKLEVVATTTSGRIESMKNKDGVIVESSRSKMKEEPRRKAAKKKLAKKAPKKKVSSNRSR